MSIKGLSKAASALALVGVVAPFLVQSVGAADEPKSALSGVAGVSDYSGSQIINKAASGNDNTGSASGTSYAGIGFTSGDLILYQVPNFDFSMDNKIADNTYGMIPGPTAETKSRMAVIVDNRYTAVGDDANGNKKYGWTLTASASPFTYTGGGDPLGATEANVLLNDVVETNNQKADADVQAVDAISQNKKGEANLDYKVGQGLEANTVTINQSVDILAGNNPVVASLVDGKKPGAVGLNFAKQYSAEFVVKAEGISKIVPQKQYVSHITWTLSSDPLH